jgi:hypothetical protein
MNCKSLQLIAATSHGTLYYDDVGDLSGNSTFEARVTNVGVVVSFTRNGELYATVSVSSYEPFAKKYSLFICSVRNL